MEKIEWLELRGVPDYLDQPSAEQQLPDGSTLVVRSPPEPGAYAREISRVYEEGLSAADNARERARILKSYTENFADLAFDPDGWLWAHWQGWRANYTPADRCLLNVMAAGVRTRASGWMAVRRSKAWVLRLARRCVRRLGDDETLTSLYREYLETARCPDPEVRDARRRSFEPIADRVRDETGYETSLDELDHKKLAGVLRAAVHHAFGVRERSLH